MQDVDSTHSESRDSARTLVERAYSSLRREILEGALEPGAKLRTEELRQRYKIGASTLREALTRLLGEALVTAEGQRGFRVAPISVDDFSDLTNVRKMIETEALRQAMIAGDDAWESRVVAAYYRLSKIEERIRDEPEPLAQPFEERNREFHFALISACPSIWLHRIYGLLYQQSERYRRISLVNRVMPRDVHAEHKAIFEAVLARDIDRACRLTDDHIDRTLSVLRQMMAQSRDSLPAAEKTGRGVRAKAPPAKAEAAKPHNR
jgi:DNA-binding GntR family transcriptional regulator